MELEDAGYTSQTPRDCKEGEYVNTAVSTKTSKAWTLRALAQSRINPSDLNEVGVAFHYRQGRHKEQLLVFAKKFFEDIKTTQRYVGVTGYDAETEHLLLGANNQNRFYEHLMNKKPPPNRMDVLKVLKIKRMP